MRRGEGEEALDRAVRALARRDHSTRSLQRKLARAGVSEAARREAIETLARAGYLDDARFARDRAARLAERGYGDERIRADLESQGVPREAVARALAALEPEPERALASGRQARRNPGSCTFRSGPGGAVARPAGILRGRGRARPGPEHCRGPLSRSRIGKLHSTFCLHTTHFRIG